MKLWDKIIFWTYAVLFFLVPLILSPWNYELFEFNKMLVVYLAAVVIGWAWVCKMITCRKFIFRYSFWDLPLLLFLTSQIISTVISIDRYTSIFGYYSRFHGGLLSTISYLLLYWGLVSNLDKKKASRLIKVILISGLLVSLYGIAEHFGIDKNLWVQDVQNRVFSTLGQPNWLAAYLNILIFIALGLFINSSTAHPIYYLLLSTIYYLCLLYTKSRSGFLGFIIPFVLFLIINFFLSLKQKKDKAKLKKISLILTTFIILSLLIGTPFSPRLGKTKIRKTENDQTKKESVDITPSSEIRKIVWKGAIDLGKKYPFFGTGVETFAYSYYWARPAEHNLTSEWDFLYNKAHNEYLNFAATTGTLGLLAYLTLIVSALIFTIKKFPSCFIFYVLISICITNFFGFSVVAVAALFFLLPAMSVSFKPASLKKYKLCLGKLETKKLITVATIIAAWGIFEIASYWLADYHFNQGYKLEKAGFLDSGLSHLNKAVRLNSHESNFYSERAIILAKTAAALTQNDQSTAATELAQPAIEDSRKALQLSPYHINLYKNQAKVFYYLAFHELKYLREGIKTLLTAEKLALTDPKIPYSIAVIYQTLDENKLAKEYFQKAIELKPNYEAAKSALEKI